jgi:hypothetical protein
MFVFKLLCIFYLVCVLYMYKKKRKTKPIEAGFQYNEITQKRFLYSILIHHKRKKQNKT